jgi:hypothetical protein
MMQAVSGNELARLEGYPFEARYSEGARAEAVRLAELAKEAYEYFSGLFPGTEPAVTARFLRPADWPGGGYGVPAYDPFERSLRIATEDNRFWQSFGNAARFASPLAAYPRLKRTYADEDGTLQLRRFFDLLVVHELEHAFEHQALATFPALWLSEVAANLALHAFVATVRPAELANLTAFPEAQRRVKPFNLMIRLRGYRSLDDFERRYPIGTEEPMSQPNYGWYQIRFLTLAREVFKADGENALRRLWAFGQSDDPRRTSPWIHFLEHRTFAGWTERLPRRELATLLGSEVSPRLGQAVADWNRWTGFAPSRQHSSGITGAEWS